jgi:hypothetical protein
MSATSADFAAERARGGPSAGLVVGVALGLMALAALAAFLLLGSGRAIDGGAKLAAAFGSADLPGGLVVETAVRTSTGDELVVVARADAAPQADAPAAAPAEPAAQAELGAPAEPAAPRIDWAALPIPAAGGPPQRITFHFAPAQRGRAVIDDLVRDVRGRDRGELGAEGGTVVVARGRLAFRGYDAEWVHLRAYERGPAFRDALRVSLSTPAAPCVLTATWPRGEPATEAGWMPVLTALGATRDGR